MISRAAVAFTADGFLLTNAHVVGGARDGQAAFADGTATSFTVVGTDPLSDLAVIRVTSADGSLHQATAERGVAFVKGTDFLLDGGENTLRLAYAGVTPAQIEEGVARLAAAYRSL